jgi:EpsI family protein
VRSLVSSPIRIALSLLLLAEIAAFHLFPKTEQMPVRPPLAQLPTEWKGWRTVAESQLDTEVQALLRADQSLNRVYAGPDGDASLFIALYETQRTGVQPHSPKVCLPGSGWVPLENRHVEVAVQGWSSPTITVNRFIVGKGEQRSVVLYWYETPWRVIANEYMAKFYTVLDGLQYRRSDTSLVRIVVRSDDGHLEGSEKLAVRFAQDFFPRIREHLPAR